MNFGTKKLFKLESGGLFAGKVFSADSIRSDPPSTRSKVAKPRGRGKLIAICTLIGAG